MKKTLLTLAMFLASYCSYAQTNLINSTGSVGIATLSPSYNLQVEKTSSQPAVMIGGGYSGSPRLQVYGLNADPNAWMGLGTDMGGGPYEHSIYFPTAPSGYTGKLTIGDYNGSTYNTRVTVLNNGYVGIGTRTPDTKLAVLGTIHANEVKVDLSVPGPDYIFKPDYKLTNLSELKDYLDKNHHLPEIPSAKQMAKDGINLGEMNTKLLQKVEELTLYLIEQNKQITDQQKINHEQQNKLDQQETRLAALEKALSKRTVNK